MTLTYTHLPLKFLFFCLYFSRLTLVKSPCNFVVFFPPQAATAVFGDRQDVAEERRSSLSAGPRGLRRGQETQQPCDHTG